MKFRVLSIDAWADIENSWSWNNWFHVDDYDSEVHGALNEENALRFFFEEMFTAHTHTRSKDESFEDFKRLYEIDDDQYNLVLLKLDNRMPLYGIEYGNKF